MKVLNDNQAYWHVQIVLLCVLSGAVVHCCMMYLYKVRFWCCRQPAPQHQLDFDSQIHTADRHTGVGVLESLVSPSAGPVSPVPIVSVAEASSGSAGLHTEISFLMCRCSMIHEDSLEAYDNDADDAEMTTIDQSHSDSELAADDTPFGQSDVDHGFGNTLEIPTSSHAVPAGGSRPLVSVRSSPQLLNEICEETETADDDDVTSSAAAATIQTHVSRWTSAEQSRHLDRLHRVHRRKIAAMVPRVASCSSSDTSDTDEIVDQNGHKQRKQKPAAGAPANVKYLGRRDSSEHSSDNDSQPCAATSYPTASNISSGTLGSAARRSSDSQCNDRQGQNRDSGRTKRAESEHSYQRHALSLSRTSRHYSSTIITDWKSLDTRLVMQLFSDCYSEEAEDAFCDCSAALDMDWIMNARNQLSDLIQLHSQSSRCLTDASDLAVMNGLVKWCNDGSLQIARDSKTNLGVNSNSVAVLTGVGCAEPCDSRLRARKVSL